MSAKANLLKYLKLRNIKKSDFYLKTGLSNGFLDKNEHISSKNLEIIFSIFGEISPDWLISNREPMLRNEVEASVVDSTVAQLEARVVELQNTIKLLQDTNDFLKGQLLFYQGKGGGYAKAEAKRGEARSEARI